MSFYWLNDPWTREFEKVLRGNGLISHVFEHVALGFEHETRGFKLETRKFELVTRKV